MCSNTLKIVNAFNDDFGSVVYSCRIALTLIKNSVLAAELEDMVLGAVTIDLERLCPKHPVNTGHRLRVRGTELLPDVANARQETMLTGALEVCVVFAHRGLLVRSLPG